MMGSSGALPTYMRIAETVTRDILGGRLKVGDKLPTEREMAAQNGVAVATLRKSLQLLTERGLIERRQGSGNYVRSDEAHSGIYSFFRLERAGQGGGWPSAELLDWNHADKPAHLPRIGEPDGPGLRIRRTRFLDDLPVAVEEIWLDGRWLGDRGLPRDKLSESLYLSYRQRLGLTISRAEDTIGSGVLPHWGAAALGHPVGHPVIRVERRAFDQRAEACEASWTWFDPERAQYFSRVP